MFVFTIIWITLKRILHNWRTVSGLLVGLILATGIMAAIPIYSAGSLQQSFVDHWITQSSFRPPLAFIVSHNNEYRANDISVSQLDNLRATIGHELQQSLRAKLISSEYFGRMGLAPLLPVGSPSPTVMSPQADIAMTSNLKPLCKIIEGRWYKERNDGVVEAVVDQSTFEKYQFLIGDKFDYWYPLQKGEELGPLTKNRIVDGYVLVPIEIVGLFQAKPGYTTDQWIFPPPYSDRLFVDPQVYANYLRGSQGLELREREYDAQWVFDYRDIRVNALPRLVSSLQRIRNRAKSMVVGTDFWYSPLSFFQKFNVERRQVALFLAALGMPALGMVLYYIMLLAGITVDSRRKEITVLHSRGGARVQVAVSFLLEWFVLGVVAVVIGPYLGIMIAELMGTSSGFLRFVNRTAIPATIGTQAYLFALGGAGVAILSGMIPVFGAVKQNIVTYTQRKDRSQKRSVWHKFFIDVILIGVSIYGFSRLNIESKNLAANQQLLFEPTFFFVPVLMVLGGGLFLLRIYPFVMVFFRWVVSKLPGVLWQLTFRRLTRSAGQYVPLMLLLIVSVSLGIYSAVTARTLSVNYEDNIRYSVGADLATTEVWYDPTGPPEAVVSEPPFYKREQIPGVISAARVMTGRADVQFGTNQYDTTSVNFMAIEPYEFAATAWYRNDFGQAKFIDYLTLLSHYRGGVIVSTQAFNQNHLQLGQQIIVLYKDQQIPSYVIGHIDYWPTLDPQQRPFIIMNLSHFQDYTALEPYNVWYKLTPSANVETIINDLVGLGVYVTQASDARTEIAEMKREPYRMGLYGLLSMSFIISAVVTALGFFVYSLFSIKARLVQFGALRAMGFSSFQLVGMLGLEQLFTIGAGLGLGTIVGIAVSRLFLPLFQYRAGNVRLPPFILVMDPQDIALIILIVAILFAIVLSVLAVILIRLRLNQAIKLGEEA